MENSEWSHWVNVSTINWRGDDGLWGEKTPPRFCLWKCYLWDVYEIFRLMSLKLKKVYDWVPNLGLFNNLWNLGIKMQSSRRWYKYWWDSLNEDLCVIAIKILIYKVKHTLENSKLILWFFSARETESKVAKELNTWVRWRGFGIRAMLPGHLVTAGPWRAWSGSEPHPPGETVMFIWLTNFQLYFRIP